MSIDVAKRRILERVPLAALIGESVPLTTQGGKKKACCPFHAEKTPSFTIYDDRYYCFGCRASGDAINFVRHQFGYSFLEALRFLAKKYSIDIPELEQSNEERTQRQVEATLYRAMAAAQSYFVASLHGPRGHAALDYLDSRGFSGDKVKEFGFGLSTDEPAALISQLREQGYKQDSLKACSLARESSRTGRLYDYFQNRLIIPIQDRHGRVIAFGGRTMGDDPAKYINSQNTKLFDKSVKVFGLDRARDVIRRQGAAVVCEGYMDVLQLWNHGVGEAVACLGTALTLHHLRILSSFASKIYLVFDGDQAGKRASLRTVAHALDVPQVELKVVVLPPKEDPDSFIRSQGQEAFRGLLSKAQDILDYAITTRVLEAHDLAIPELISQEFTPWLLSVQDPMQRVFLINRIAHLTGMPADDIARAMATKAKMSSNQDKPRSAAKEESQPEAPPAPKRTTRPLAAASLEIEVFGHIFHSKVGELSDLGSIRSLIVEQLELDDLWQTFALEMLDSLEQERAPAERERSSWITGVDPLVLELINFLQNNGGAYTCDNREARITKLVRTQRMRALKDSVKSMKAKLLKAPATPEGQAETLEVLTAISQLNKEIVELERSGG